MAQARRRHRKAAGKSPLEPQEGATAPLLRSTETWTNRHALVAVGSAMQAALLRQVAEEVPEWVRFDLPNAFVRTSTG